MLLLRSAFVRVLVLLLACALGAALTWLFMGGRLDAAQAQVQTLQEELTHKQEQWLGQTSYTSYLTLGKQALSEQMKLLTAIVVRDEGVTQVIERSILGIASSGTVAIWYTVDYPFGYDLQSEKYDIRVDDLGIAIYVEKPRLLAKPAVHSLRYRILSGGLFTDEKAAVIKLYEEAAQQAHKQGRAMAADPAVMALCEKKLVQFLDAFLRKQAGVKSIAPIRVVYVNA